MKDSIKTIFVIEDEKDIQELIRYPLSSLGHQIILADSIDQTFQMLDQVNHIDLFIVDWMLPGVMSGLEFVRKIRLHNNFERTPIIMITALSQPENIIAGLEAGADDYLPKPFDLGVLQARVKVQLRQSEYKNLAPADHFEVGDLRVEKKKCKVFIKNEEIPLTSTEFKILNLLISRPGHVFTREQFIKHIQGENIFVSGRTIDTHMAGLRKKMASASSMIETIRGIGYRFQDELS